MVRCESIKKWCVILRRILSNKSALVQENKTHTLMLFPAPFCPKVWWGTMRSQSQRLGSCFKLMKPIVWVLQSIANYVELCWALVPISLVFSCLFRFFIFLPTIFPWGTCRCWPPCPTSCWARCCRRLVDCSLLKSTVEKRSKVDEVDEVMQILLLRPSNAMLCLNRWTLVDHLWTLQGGPSSHVTLKTICGAVGFSEPRKPAPCGVWVTLLQWFMVSSSSSNVFACSLCTLCESSESSARKMYEV